LSCWAIVAIKSRLERKQRLSGLLDSVERGQLTRFMLDRVVAAASDAREVSEVLIVCPEREALPTGYPVLQDAGTGLNVALDLARAHARSLGASELLMLPADLPLVCESDIEALENAGRRAGVAIATDHAGTGTNGLYLSAELAFHFRFGPDSRARHEAEARRSGHPAAMVSRPGLATDLDTPADFLSLYPAPIDRPRPAVLPGEHP
jgi:2-phospho-L-lactate guanylyltransferase